MNTSEKRLVLPSVAIAGLVLLVGSLGVRVGQSLVVGRGLSTFTGFGSNTVLTLALLCLVGGLLSRTTASGGFATPAKRLFLVGGCLAVLAAVIAVTLESLPSDDPAALVPFYGPTVVTSLGVFLVLRLCLAARPALASDTHVDERSLPFDAGPLVTAAVVALAMVVLQLLLGVFGWPSLAVVGGDLWKVVWISFAFVAAPTGAFLFALGVVFRREFSLATAIGAAGLLTVVVCLLGVSLFVVEPGETQVVLANVVGQLQWVVQFVAAVLLFRPVLAFRAGAGQTGRTKQSRHTVDSW
ncbi:hypothetical protein [Haloarchaeobius sp. HME9146]|uniref:hypothetical protein n=1 Tax=Haloarchaeobius sp. HME9146 TaxID=2978732 RepID=UPI0021BF0564|nr:hypothetical protein [Haloarchaeobius sp. HME9146]MCT9097924.1 hypothetical protein [Haloarchaeobius sp. HME9146]